MEPNRNYQTRTTTRLERSARITLFALGNQWGLTIGAAAVTGALVSLIVLYARVTQRGNVWDWVQNVATCFTLGTALLIWASERAREWRLDLPKRLTARFVYQGREVMVCEGAYLAGESDIRQWAQQLGAQMADNDRKLALLPDLEQGEPEVMLDINEGCHFLHYEFKVGLDKLPDHLEKLKKTKGEQFPLVHWTRANFGNVPMAPTSASGPEVPTAGTV